METGTGWVHIEKSPGPEPCYNYSPLETYVFLLSVSNSSESSNAWPVIQDKPHRFLIKIWVIGNVSIRTYDNWVLCPGPEFEYWGEIQPESPILDEIFSSSSSGWSFSVLCHVWILVVFLSLRSFVGKSSPFRELASIFFHLYSYVMARFQQWRIWRSITVPGDVLPWRTGNYGVLEIPGMLTTLYRMEYSHCYKLFIPRNQ